MLSGRAGENRGGQGPRGLMRLGGNGEPSTRDVLELRSEAVCSLHPVKHHFLSETWNSGDPGPEPGPNQTTGKTAGGPGREVPEIEPLPLAACPDGACLLCRQREVWSLGHLEKQPPAPASAPQPSVGDLAAWVQLELGHFLTRLLMDLLCVAFSSGRRRWQCCEDYGAGRAWGTVAGHCLLARPWPGLALPDVLQQPSVLLRLPPGWGGS